MRNLILWFKRNKRPLPWRDRPTPYAVWVSEIMLQQTQVKTVIPYYLRWMETFPTLADLARAEEAFVIKLWEGLGYYSRARHLLAGAKTCLAEFGGEVPRDPVALSQLKGIGPYTRNAILSFAFHQKAAAVDGNVLRVMSRLQGIAKDISLPATKKEIETRVLKLLPAEKPWETMEALIELGALVCTKQPLCHQCPLKTECKAYLTNKTAHLPIKKKKAAITKIVRHTLLIKAKEHILLSQVPKGQIMEGLWEFPYFEHTLPTHLGSLSLNRLTPLPPVTHTFTRYKATLIPYTCTLRDRADLQPYQWVHMQKLQELPFSSGHRKLLVHL